MTTPPLKFLLVVHDDMAAHKLHVFLTELGYQSMGTLATVYEAMVAVRLEEVDFIVVDAMAALELEHIGAIESLRSNPSLRGIIVATAVDSAEEGTILSWSPDAFIGRPFQISRIKDAVELTCQI